MLLCAAVTFAQSTSSLKAGEKQYQEENYAEAIKYFNKAAVEEPNNPRVPYLTGRAYLDMNNYRQSASYLEKAIAMDSTRNTWMFELALIYSSIPDYKKSLQYFLLAGEKGYKQTSSYLENVGYAYNNLGQYDKGLQLLKQVLEKKPSDPELLYQVAQTYFHLAKYQDAIDHWDKVLEIDKENAEALYMIGVCYQKKGEKQKGQQLCDRAIEMDPSLASKRRRMGGDF
jgi:tetratricopeptide (TPR) repeat protein